MNSGDRPRNVATNVTSPYAVRDLQPQLGRVLQVVGQQVRAPDVGLIGPGAPEAGQFYPPQVRETIGTLLQRGGSSSLQVYYHDDPTRPRGDYIATDPDSGASVRIRHSELDLTRPHLTPARQHDVVISTRVLAPVLRDEEHAGDAAYRQGVVEAWRAMGKSDSVFLTDRGAAEVVVQSHRTLFNSGPVDLSESGRDPNASVMMYRFGAFADASAQSTGRAGAITPVRSRTASVPAFRLFRVSSGQDASDADTAHDRQREERLQEWAERRASASAAAREGRDTSARSTELSDADKAARRRAYSASLRHRTPRQ